MIKCITKKECGDLDYKTQSVHKYPNIPKGAEVTYIETIYNFYGKYSKVSWNNHIYYVKDTDLEFRSV